LRWIKMRFAVSNIGLPAYDHAALLPNLCEIGFDGLEVAVSRVWPESPEFLGGAEVAAYRRAVEAAGLRVVGLHAVLFGRPDLGLFKGRETTEKTVEFMIRLSSICRDLGGKTIIYGGGRVRGLVPVDEAHAECMSFLAELLPRIEEHKTIFCLEPLGPKDTDFLNSAEACVAFRDVVAHPSLGIHFDAKALVENGELHVATFERVRGRLQHFHVNEPGFSALKQDGAVDHTELGRMLRSIEYDGWISLEQRMFSETDAVSNLARSAAVMRSCYGGR
jgi:sugar phosphate isomerase/epimerase